MLFTVLSLVTSFRSNASDEMMGLGDFQIGRKNVVCGNLSEEDFFYRKMERGF